MNLIDRTLLAFAPQRAVDRELARRQYGALAAPRASEQSETRWRGASRLLRSLRTWLPGLGSPQSDLSAGERATLTGRSRDAYRNHLIARAAVGRCRTNIVGTGLMFRPAVDAEALGIGANDAERLNGIIAREWALWAEDPRECDAEATHDHYQLQALALVSALLSGDVFVGTPWIARPGTLYGTRLKFIEADRVCNPGGALNTPALVDGVVLDRDGAPLRYWVARHHPADALRVDAGWDALDAFGAASGRRRAFHVRNDVDRPGQVRGAPYLAPILEPLQKLDKYGSAELTAAVVSALFTVFIERQQEELDHTGKPMEAIEGTGESAAGVPVDSNELRLGNGAVLDLAPGEKANFANPARPNANFDPFFMAVVRQIGAALELPVDELLLSYNASYSAARAAMLQAWRFYTARRWSLVVQFCQPSVEVWFDEAVSGGRIPVTGYADPARRRAYTRGLWIGPARGAIDEAKEANAAGKRIEIGISNETIETAAMTGEAWTSVYAQRVREVQARRRDGLPVAGEKGKAAESTPRKPPRDALGQPITP